jgi:hypothetical protein
MALEKIIVAIVVELSMLLVVAVFGGARLHACSGETPPEIDLR